MSQGPPLFLSGHSPVAATHASGIPFGNAFRSLVLTCPAQVELRPIRKESSNSKGTKMIIIYV